MAGSTTVLFKAHVPSRRLRKVEQVLGKLGLNPEDAFNMLLAQIELREALPFEVAMQPARLLSADEQAGEWTHAFSAY